MKRKGLSVLVAMMLLLTFGANAFAAEGPIREVTTTDADTSSDTVYFIGDTNARGNLAYGTLSITNSSPMVATVTGATYANNWSSLLKCMIELYRYNPTTGVSTYIDGVNFYGTNGYSCGGSKAFTVPSKGYYFATGQHAYKSEEFKYTQTEAIKIN